MMINAVWLLLFQQNQVWGFAVALVDAIAMLATNVYVMGLATSTTNTIWEWIGLRGGFSVYAGWVTAATILNVTYLLKSLGLQNGNLAGLSEEQVTVGVVWVAFMIYNLVAWTERNPLYGSIFIWVILAIYNNIVWNKPTLTLLRDNTTAIAITHGISMVILWTWTSAEAWYDVETVGWNTGIWY